MNSENHVTVTIRRYALLMLDVGYRNRRLDAALSVCVYVYVGHGHELCKNSCTDREPV